MINNRVNFTFLGFVICLWLLPSMVFAQKPMPHLTPSSGILASPFHSSAYDIEIDENNYAYIAGTFGVVRCNGNSLLSLKREGMLNDKVGLAFYKDFEGKLWLKTYRGGLGIIGDSAIIPYRFSDSIKQFDTRFFEDVYEDSQGELHLAVRGEGYFTVSSQGVVKERFLNDNGVNGFVVREIEGRPFVFYVFTQKRKKSKEGMHLYYWPKDDSLRLITQLNSYKPIHKSSLVKHKNGGFTLSVGSHEVVHFNKDSLIKKTLLPSPVIDLFLDRDQNLWAGTDSDGIFLSRNSTIDFEPFLLKNTASAVLAQDRDGGLWIKSAKEFFYHLPFLNVKSYEEQMPEIRKRRISEMAEGNGKVYATYSAGDSLIVFSPTKVEIIEVPKFDLQDFKSKSVSNHPTAVKYDSIRNWVWLGFEDKVAGFDGQTWRHFSFSKLTNHVHQKVADVAVKSNGLLAVAMDHKVIVMDPDGVKEPYIVDVHAEGLRFTRKILSDQNDVLYLHAANGIWCVDGDSCFKLRLPKYPGQDSEIQVTTIHFGLGRVWISSNAGLYSIENGVVKLFESSNSIKKLRPYDFANDDKGNMWVRESMDKSCLIKIMETNGVFESQRLSSNLGISRNEIAVVDNFAIAENKAFIQSSNQIFVLDLRELNEDRLNPRVFISSVYVNGSRLENMESYRLESDQNTIRFDFDFNLYASGEVVYRYRLMGLSEEWTMSKFPIVQYTNLDPGDYKFELEGKTPNGEWVSNKTIDVFIQTPFWQTWWFISLIVLTGIGLIGASFFFWFRNKARRSELTIAKLMADQRALRAQMNPHFLFNTLVSIQELVFNNGPVVAAKNISMFATLMRKILVQSSQEAIPLEDEIEMLTLYVKLESLRFDDSFSYNISVDDGIDKNRRIIPPMLIQPFVENAIKHGLQNQFPKGGTVQISFQLNGKGLLCIIEDNGVGMQATQKKGSSNSKEKTESFSMQAIRERISILNMRSGEEIKLKVGDRTDEVEGTRIELYLP